jgi:signal peptide peptidase SppA
MDLDTALAALAPATPVTPDLYAHVRRAIASQVWAILPDKLDAILGVLDERVLGVRLTAEEAAARVGTPSGALTAANAGTGTGVAVIPIHGTISQRPSVFSQASGGTSTQEIAQAFRAAMADPAVGSVLFDVDSPGGTVPGVPELAAEIRAARGQGKPVVAVANGLAASAAYYLASAADELVVTPSGEVGSIGVFAVHEDRSGLYAATGVTHSLISAGRFKTEGNPYQPLGEDARAAIQAKVDDFYGMFTRAVARHRNATVEAVRGGFGEGRTVLARKAVELGMADRVDTFDATLARLASSAAPAPVTALPAPAAASLSPGPAPRTRVRWPAPQLARGLTRATTAFRSA